MLFCSRKSKKGIEGGDVVLKGLGRDLLSNSSNLRALYLTSVTSKFCYKIQGYVP